MTTELVDTKAIAKRYGVSRRTVTERWSKRPDFPAPVQRISQKATFWDWQQVISWRAPVA